VFREQAQLAQHRRLVPRDVFVIQAIAPDVHDGREGDLEAASGRGDAGDSRGGDSSSAAWPGKGESRRCRCASNSQPIDLSHVRAFEEEFVDDAVDADGSAD
jgi:hypothetical protein